MRLSDYSADAWQRLGRLVSAERLRAGYRTGAEWAAAVGISDRTLLSLERGESVSSGTLESIAVTLGWPTGYPLDVLDDAPKRRSQLSNSQLLEELADRLSISESVRPPVLTRALDMAELRDLDWIAKQLETLAHTRDRASSCGTELLRYMASATRTLIQADTVSRVPDAADPNGSSPG